MTPQKVYNECPDKKANLDTFKQIPVNFLEHYRAPHTAANTAHTTERRELLKFYMIEMPGEKSNLNMAFLDHYKALQQ
ncbi:hypothetical protein RRG08_037469 [Elysia crispata]|uniref:Uncharacterized protein n=1 Tax=Elysia crispata TaxID=231223 RepID=A0AAE1AZ16_9GAST|nr:hypothetical protein RRG08_037469 [Elysia crispata]